MAESIDNSLLLEVLKEIRKEQRDQRTLLLLTSEDLRKLDQLTETRLLANFEVRIENLIERRLAQPTGAP